VKKGDGIEENNTKAGSSNISTFFPSNVRTILSNLRRFFPRLQSLRIEFKPIDWEDFWNDENFDYSDGETAEQISSAEDDRAWRALMAKTQIASPEPATVHQGPGNSSAHAERKFLRSAIELSMISWAC